MIRIIFKLLILSIIIISCEKENLENNKNAKLHFSEDTITFDTIFASIGSITKTLTVYNHNDFDITTNVDLRGVSAANFRINIDGIAGNNQRNILIPSNDSIFVFLEVTIDPSNNNTPYILSDSLVFTTANSVQNVNLIAWGQDAYFHTANTFGSIINGTDTTRFYYHLLDCSIPWENDKPHVIYGYAVIDPQNTLIINEGCQIYMHKNSGILVGNPFKEQTGGTLKVHGALGNEVVFQGDRLDNWYKDIPGQWDRIWFTPGSIDNEINYAIIKNGNIGLHADTVYNNNPTLKVNNSIIKNMSGIGILGQGADIEVTNTVISECGQFMVACNIGGNYNFTHCTFANYWNYNRRNTPSILLNNYYEGANGNVYIRNLESANFVNCIIDGSLSSEISYQNNESGIFNYSFDHCLLKIDPTIDTDNSNYINILKNISPEFSNENDFNLSEISPVIDFGRETSITLDILGNVRSDPDLGSYELVE